MFFCELHINYKVFSLVSDLYLASEEDTWKNENQVGETFDNVCICKDFILYCHNYRLTLQTLLDCFQQEVNCY